MGWGRDDICNLFTLTASPSLPSAPAGFVPPPVTVPGSLPSGRNARSKINRLSQRVEEALRSREVVRAGDPSFHDNHKGLQFPE